MSAFGKAAKQVENTLKNPSLGEMREREHFRLQQEAMLSLKVAEQRKQIEALHEKGHYPADYSLGFANALILAEYLFTGYREQTKPPNFYDRTTSVGHMPKIMALNPEEFGKMIEEATARDQEQDFLANEILDAAREVIEVSAKCAEEFPSEFPYNPALDLPMKNLRSKLMEFDDYAFEDKEKEPEADTAQAPSEDASAPNTLASDSLPEVTP